MKDLANRKAVTSLVRSKNRNLVTKNNCRGNQDQDLSVPLIKKSVFSFDPFFSFLSFNSDFIN